MSEKESMVPSKQRTTRVWVDGCFDLMHYGHANALRQAKAMGDYLIVGVHSDAEIALHKGPPVIPEQERYEAVAACKWVDQVVPNAPYFTTVAILDQYNCDFCVHGDDITTTVDGIDCYAEVKAAGRYRECKRSQGVSTTDIVGRMLLMTRDHHHKPTPQSQNKGMDGLYWNLSSEDLNKFTLGGCSKVKKTTISQFLPTTKKIIQFSNGTEPNPNDRVIYADGAFDLFHTGHIEFLRRARELGDYLLVGVHDDATVNQIKGGGQPVMNLHERVLSVLACRYVDEVIIGAPYSVSIDVLEKVYKVYLVAHGSTSVHLDTDGGDPYALPKKLGIYRQIQHPKSSLSANAIIDRILQHRKLYCERQLRKLEKEAALEQ